MLEQVLTQDIRNLSEEELAAWFKKNKLPAFRVKQLNEWLWKHAAGSFDEMSSLSVELREKLSAEFVINKIRVSTLQKSEDGTIKNAFELFDKQKVEGVLIPAKDRMTACVSSQAGCSLACKFCATGTLELKRNLDAGEIFDQVTVIADEAKKYFDHRLTNIVYMGMGEPLLNYNNVVESIRHITSPEGLGMSPSRITISTAGIAKMIRKLADDKIKCRLALSLHAPTDEQRSQIMPINEHNKIDVLMDALEYFHKMSKSRITFEYILFKDFNDTVADAKKLVKLCRRFPVHVNLIEYNPVAGLDFAKPNKNTMEHFQMILQEKGVDAQLRVSRGKDIDAACGQLANKK